MRPGPRDSRGGGPIGPPRDAKRADSRGLNSRRHLCESLMLALPSPWILVPMSNQPFAHRVLQHILHLRIQPFRTSQYVIKRFFLPDRPMTHPALIDRAGRCALDAAHDGNQRIDFLTPSVDERSQDEMHM